MATIYMGSKESSITLMQTFKELAQESQDPKFNGNQGHLTVTEWADGTRQEDFWPVVDVVAKRPFMQRAQNDIIWVATPIIKVGSWIQNNLELVNRAGLGVNVVRGLNNSEINNEFEDTGTTENSHQFTTRYETIQSVPIWENETKIEPSNNPRLEGSFYLLLDYGDNKRDVGASFGLQPVEIIRTTSIGLGFIGVFHETNETTSEIKIGIKATKDFIPLLKQDIRGEVKLSAEYNTAPKPVESPIK